jgi:hypothetical protein
MFTSVTMQQYNTQQKKMALPEYGRSIQNMVDYAVTIENREERQRCADTIIGIMGNMFPHLRDVPDFKHKLWDHLAIMSDFKLDIEYPFELIRKDNLVTKPDFVPYTSSDRIVYRHYGRLLEMLIKRAAALEDGLEKDQLVAQLCNHMRKSYTAWNKEGMDDAKLDDDLRELSDGKLRLTDRIYQMMEERNNTSVRPRNNSYQARPANNNNNNNNGKGQRR